MQRLRGGLRETGRSFEIRNFRLFFVGQTISQVGNWLSLVAQVLLVLSLTDNNGVAVGILTACQFLPVLVLGLWTGVVADRTDKRKLLLIVWTFSMLQSFLLAALVFAGDPPLLAVYGVALLGGFGSAFDNPARRAFVVEMVPESHLQNAVSLNSALMTGSRVVGPALAGLLVATAGFGWCFLVNGISYLAVLYGLWRMDKAELHASVPTPHAKGQVRAGLRYVRSVSDLWVPLGMMVIAGTLAFNFAVVMPLFAKVTLEGSDTTFTLLYSVLSFGSFVGAVVSARRTTNSVSQVVQGAMLMGVALVGLAASPTVVTSFPAAMLVGFAGQVFMTSGAVLLQMRVAPEVRGRVMALMAVVMQGSTPIGGPVLGFICEAMGARVGWLVGSVGCFSAAAWAVSAQRRVRKLDPAPTESTARLRPV